MHYSTVYRMWTHTRSLEAVTSSGRFRRRPFHFLSDLSVRRRLTAHPIHCMRTWTTNTKICNYQYPCFLLYIQAARTVSSLRPNLVEEYSKKKTIKSVRNARISARVRCHNSVTGLAPLKSSERWYGSHRWYSKKSSTCKALLGLKKKLRGTNKHHPFLFNAVAESKTIVCWAGMWELQSDILT